MKRQADPVASKITSCGFKASHLLILGVALFWLSSGPATRAMAQTGVPVHEGVQLISEEAPQGRACGKWIQLEYRACKRVVGCKGGSSIKNSDVDDLYDQIQQAIDVRTATSCRTLECSSPRFRNDTNTFDCVGIARLCMVRSLLYACPGKGGAAGEPVRQGSGPERVSSEPKRVSSETERVGSEPSRVGSGTSRSSSRSIAAGRSRSAPGSPVGAGSPPLTIEHVETDTNFGDTSIQGTVLYANTAAPTNAEPEGWWLRVDVRISNQGANPILLTAFELDTDASEPSQKPLAEPALIPAGKAKTIKAHGIGGSGPKPTVLEIRAFAIHPPGIKPAAWSQPASETVALAEYENATPTGGYRFPARYDDTPLDWYWTPGNAHLHTTVQRYAYDLGIVRGPAFTRYTDLALQREVLGGLAAGTYNSDFLVWNQPIYAMADGVIVTCRRSVADQQPGESGESSGNALKIEHGDGEYVLYAHLRELSIPQALCPVESDPGDEDNPNHVPVAVTEGQFLGRVGNTGHSSGPHFHTHLQEAEKSGSGETRGLPLRFYDVHVRSFYPETDPFLSWNHVTASEPAAVGSPEMLIGPNVDE